MTETSFEAVADLAWTCMQALHAHLDAAGEDRAHGHSLLVCLMHEYLTYYQWGRDATEAEVLSYLLTELVPAIVAQYQKGPRAQETTDG